MSEAPQDTTSQDSVQAPMGALPAAGDTTPSAREQADMGSTLGLPEVATRLGVSVKTAYRAVRAGKYAGAYKVPGPSGEQWVVPVSTVELLLSRTVKKTPSQDSVQAEALQARVHELELLLATARTEATERAVTIEALQGAMRQLTAATENLTNATEQQRATIALTEAALKVAQARKWWQRTKPVGEG